MRTVIGLFDDHADAMQAHEAIVKAGYGEGLDVLTADDESDVPKLARLATNVPKPDSDVYLEGVRKGGTLLTATVADDKSGAVAEIMSSHHLVNIADRAQTLRQDNANLAPLIDTAKDENVLEVVEEELQVGKTSVERGRMRIYNVVTEQAVEKAIPLRDETLVVRRRPVARAASDADFQNRTYEMTEVDEVAVASKTARVVEEVVLDKEVAENVEVVKGTVRHQDVVVERVDDKGNIIKE